jgi:alpha-galactosidase
VHVRRGDGAIEVETSRLRLRLDLDTLSLHVNSSEGGTRLAGARAAVDSGEGLLYGERTLVDGYGDVRSRTGLATRIDVRSRCARALELRLELDVAEEWQGLSVQLSVTNRGESAIPIGRLLPLRIDVEEGGEFAFPFPPEELRFFRMGYQSWTPAGYVRLTEREPRPRLGFVRRIHQGPFTPEPQRGLHVSDFVTTLRSPASPALTLGFTSHHDHLTHVTLRNRGAEVRALETVVATEGRLLAPGECVQGERLWLGLDPAGSDGLAEWAKRTGREMDAPVPARVGTGWCSWYQFFTRVTAADIDRNLEALAPPLTPLETVQIDDGYQATVGDWLEWDPGFPEGVAPLAARIRSAGFRAGIWLAPFVVSRASRVAREHPDWLLRSARGRPVVADVNPNWKGVICYALDPTHDEVRGWLAEVVSTLRGAGFDYLKLDFLYAGALAGRRADPTKPLAAAYRQAITTMRRAAEPDPFLLGCGAPMGPSVGLFEAMRVGADVAPKWRSRLEDAAAGLPAAASARNSVRNVLARAPFHQRLWVNDPDCLLLRDRATRLSEDEVRTLVAAALVSGGLLLISDDLANLSASRRQLLERLVPPLGRTPDTGPITGAVPEMLTQSFPDGSRLVLVTNLSERERRTEVCLSTLGLAPPIHVYDVWEDRLQTVHEARLRIGPLAPHACALLRLTPMDERPRVVGSTLHLSGGAVEAEGIRADGPGGARLRLRVPSPRRGRVLVDPGCGRAVATHVEFSGDLELSVAGVQTHAAPADAEEQEGETE